jgi:hypothetical protein
MTNTEKVVLRAVVDNFNKNLLANFDPDDFDFNEIVSYVNKLEATMRNNRTLLEGLLSEPSTEEKEGGMKL